MKNLNDKPMFIPVKNLDIEKIVQQLRMDESVMKLTLDRIEDAKTVRRKTLEREFSV